MDGVREAFAGRHRLRSFVVGRDFGESARAALRAATGDAMRHIFPALTGLRHLHVGHTTLIAPTQLIQLCQHLSELSVDLSGTVDAPDSDDEDEDRPVPVIGSALQAALAVAVPSLNVLTVMGCADGDLRDLLAARRRSIEPADSADAVQDAQCRGHDCCREALRSLHGA